MDLSLHIILQKPTVGVDFGLQKGAGNPNCATVKPFGGWSLKISL
jgi:hypothetical protein